MTSRWILMTLLLSLSCCAGEGQTPLTAEKTPATAAQSASLLAAAEATRKEGRFSEAVEIYQQLLATAPDSVEGQYGMAECLFSLGRAKDAKAIFDALAANEKFHAVALQGSGLSSLALGQRDDAAKLLQDAVAADPKLWRALNGLALIADDRHQPDEAGKIYDQAMAINPNSSVLLNNRGYSRLAARHADQAIADFRQALTLEPNSETIQNNLRLAMAMKGDYAEATKGVTRDTNAVVLNNVGYVALQRGDLDVAEGLLSRAMTDSPRYNDTVARNLDQVMAAKAAGVK